MKRLLLVIPALLLPASPGTAQEPGPLVIDVRAERLVASAPGAAEPGPALEPATGVRPGEEIHYTVRFTNAGREPLEHASITAAIPPGLRYVEGSATGPGTDVSFSIDGGADFAAPGALGFATEGRRPVPAEFYTDIRWVMRHALEPGAVGLARFRAIATGTVDATGAENESRHSPSLDEPR